MSKTLDEIRPTYQFNESCQDTVPQAIIAFLESTGFEDAIRNAISLGGDSDTLAAITGSIAEAAYGVPDEMKEKALSFLNKPLTEVYERWTKLIEQIVLCGSPADGYVLDPFLGTGTTWIVSERLGRNCVGFEINADFFSFAKERFAECIEGRA